MLRHLLLQRKSTAERKTILNESGETRENAREAPRTVGRIEVEITTDTNAIAGTGVASAIDTATVIEMTTESKENVETTTIETLLHVIGVMTITGNQGARMNTGDEIVIEKRIATTKIIVADQFRRRSTNAGLARTTRGTRPRQSTIEGALRLAKT